LNALNSLIYRFFTLSFVASSGLDVASMVSVARHSFDRDPYGASQGIIILLATVAIPIYLLWRNLVTLPSDRSLLPSPTSPSRAWGLGLAMAFVWLGSLVALAWLASIALLAAGVDSKFLSTLGGAYLTGTLKIVAVPIIFAVELMTARSRN
jgi:hypothetical protein